LHAVVGALLFRGADVPTVVIYTKLVLLQVKSQLQYPANFVLSLLATFLFTSLDLATILVIFANISSLGQWNAPDVIFLYAASASSFSLADMMLGGLDRLPQLVRDGNFDSMLFRPRSPFFQLLASDFVFSRIGRLIQSVIVVIVISAVYLHVTWSLAKIAILIMAIISGSVILGAVWICGACISFWIDGAGEFVNSFSTGSLFIAQYPITIYPIWLRWAATFVIPVGFVIYMPASYLLDKPAAFGLPVMVRIATPLIAVLAALAATLVWRVSIRYYRSAGG
jgi:ABC-2 type transport system permease protein